MVNCENLRSVFNKDRESFWINKNNTGLPVEDYYKGEQVKINVVITWDECITHN